MKMLFLISALLVQPTIALSNCADRDAIIAFLREKYDESPTGNGLADGAIVEVWSNPETGTFTVLTTNTEGLTCIRSSGVNWYAIEPEPKGVLN